MKKIKDNDEVYLKWLEENPSGYVVNCYRNPTPKYLILHRARCGTIKSSNRNNWTTKSFIKICSLDKTELKNWARNEVIGELKACQHCKP